MFAFSIAKRLAVLTLTLLFAFFYSIAYAQSSKNTLTPPPGSINFSGITYELIYESKDEPTYIESEHDSYMGYTLRYRADAQGPAQSPRYHELVMDLFSDEFIGDTYDEKSCSLFKDFDQSGKSPSWFLNYKACDEIFKLKNENPGVISVNTNQHTGEIFVTSIISMNKHSQTGKFTQFSISRYTSIPIDIDHIHLVLRYSFSMAIYGPHEEKTAELIEIMNQDDGKIVKALTQASIPQFFLDKATSYVAHPGYWE